MYIDEGNLDISDWGVADFDEENQSTIWQGREMTFLDEKTERQQVIFNSNKTKEIHLADRTMHDRLRRAAIDRLENIPGVFCLKKHSAVATWTRSFDSYTFKLCQEPGCRYNFYIVYPIIKNGGDPFRGEKPYLGPNNR